MLVGIIKEETKKDDYYIHLNEKNEYYIIHVNDNTVEVLKNEDIKNLFNILLSSKLTYKEKNDDYDIYLDEANNKRYFRNGVEDFNLFINNNGIDATLYLEKINKSKNPNAKRIRIISTLLVFEIMFSPALILPIFHDSKITDDIEIAAKYYKNLETDELKKMIYDSKYLSISDKEILSNDDLLEFVLENSNTNRRKYILRNRLNEIKLESFKYEDEDSNVEGYYIPTDLNTIHIHEDIDKDSVNYKDTLSHEYIHLLQDNNKYHYIQEACAEMISAEFCDAKIDVYEELVKRVQVLMEIIGPKPVIECNFKGDTRGFEDEIGKYLSLEDKKNLLEQFSTPIFFLFESRSNLNYVNAKIDEILAKMYQAKTGEDIKNDFMIRAIYNSGVNDRLYFNENKEEFDKDYFLNPSRIEYDKLNINDVIKSSQVKKYIWSKRNVKQVNNDELITFERIETTDFSKIGIKENEWVDIEFIDGTRGHVEYDFIANKWKEVEHFQLSYKYEPSIKKKFPEQFKEKDNEIELLDMLESEETHTNQKVK